jgi:hypothetical protein
MGVTPKYFLTAILGYTEEEADAVLQAQAQKLETDITSPRYGLSKDDDDVNPDFIVGRE